MPKASEKSLKAITAKIAAFAAARRESPGGWGPVLPGDVQGLYDIFQAIVDLKWDADQDGRRPVEIALVDRTTCESSPFIPVRYRRDDDSDFLDQIWARAGNLSAAFASLDVYLRLFAMHRHDEQGEAAAVRGRENPLHPRIADLLDAVREGIAGDVDLLGAHSDGRVELTTQFRRTAEDAVLAAGGLPRMPTLEPCTCGARKKAWEHAPATGDADPGPLLLRCAACGRHGPSRMTRRDAGLAWNESIRRAKKRQAAKPKRENPK